mgnify:CR=1 FL=1|tara:strand:- start:308 stop:565 length:258 start_codon:yes stop_codon:yes gene_type:complete
MTRNEYKVYQYCKKFILEHKISPSYSEITEGCSFKSRSQSWGAIERLIKKDYLKKVGKYGDSRRLIINRDYEKGGIKIGKATRGN